MSGISAYWYISTSVTCLGFCLRDVIQIWNMNGLEGFISHIRSGQGDYNVRAHLAEMIALLGTPPKILIQREIRWSEVKWSHAVPNSEGKLFQTAREYFGGLFSTLKATLYIRI